MVFVTVFARTSGKNQDVSSWIATARVADLAMTGKRSAAKKSPSSTPFPFLISSFPHSNPPFPNQIFRTTPWPLAAVLRTRMSTSTAPTSGMMLEAIRMGSKE